MDEVLARAGSLKELQTRWQQNRDRFNLAIEEHKTLQESIAALTHKIDEERQALIGCPVRHPRPPLPLPPRRTHPPLQ